MFIQFAGYDIEANSRIYNFDVMDLPRDAREFTVEDAREFTVEIESKASRCGSLKLQDGPGICLERLRRELERETPELRAESHLRIGEQDVQEYLARQHPQRKAFGHKSELANPLNPHQMRVFPAADKPFAGFRT